MKQRTVFVQLRLTPEEAKQLRGRAVPYGTMSNYIRTALRQFVDMDDAKKLRLLDQMVTVSTKCLYELSHISGNLNQTLKRANELSVAGLLTPAYLAVVTTTVRNTHETLKALKEELLTVAKKVAKT